MHQHATRLLLCTTLLVISAFAAGAQEDNHPFAVLLQENPSRYGLNTHVYEGHNTTETPAPKGYKPFYISHYGRHGTRSDWAMPMYQQIVDKLQKGDEQGILTPEGKILLECAREVIVKHDGMDGRLTALGRAEHRGIAERLFARYPKLLRKGKVFAVSSTVPRCMISMTAFTDRLTELAPDLDMIWDCGEKFQEYVAYGCPDDVFKETGEALTSLEVGFKPDSIALLTNLFASPDEGAKIVDNATEFEQCIYQVARIVESFGMEESLFHIIPQKDLYHIFDSANAELYLRCCNSAGWGRRCVSVGAPLVEDIARRADEAIAGNGVVADLRFGHDFPYLILVSYLGLEDVGQRLTLEECMNKWFGPAHVPFAANLQIVFYRSRKGPTLVKFLANERETLLRGLEPLTGPYYEWEIVKKNLEGYLR